MAKKNGDLFTDMVEGAFWGSAAIHSNFGNIGCLFASVIFAWFFLIPVIISMILDIDVEGVGLFWLGIVTPIAGFFVYRKIKKLLKEDERKAKELKNHKQAIRSSYTSLTSVWTFTERERNRWVVSATHNDPVFLDEQERWRTAMANQLIRRHNDYERCHGKRVSVEERISAQRDIWIIYRVSQLIPQYAELTQFWVPSFDELHNTCLSIQLGKSYEELRRIKFDGSKWRWLSLDYLARPKRENFDPFMAVVSEMVYQRTEILSYQHAEMEYDSGRIVSLYHEDTLSEKCIPPPAKPLDTHTF